jgi:hypothetical protein
MEKVLMKIMGLFFTGMTKTEIKYTAIALKNIPIVSQSHKVHQFHLYNKVVMMTVLSK